ncbi:MAG: hypothetical protein HKL87_01910 [Acidimicrobiaceae bacterium]|nr:hypothetical protein [Acidimicrobiaceae bacterium]
MTPYLWLVLLVVTVNVLPAFAPPTWSVLVFFVLSYHLNDVALVLLGVASATLGRGLLALASRRLRHHLPRRYVMNVTTAGQRLVERRGRLFATWILFLVAPISSSALFVAVGVMGTVRLRPILVAFALGRVVSYSVYVAGARAAKSSSLGPLLTSTLHSPWALGLQVVLVLFVVLLGLKDWSKESSR